ncbi:hypothetical protein KO519_09520 [Paraglaciecola agarilytica]|uniref:hypothetical protein n=1 Tax=Paraglaciecola chathamensis TaxID=368405 RepID=UPI001C087CD1|nr:hypothetical protein [Paraglaciecola agarilytica]MBU3017927.1 hypothetical protein [Paraglaciecola agarilytica]
MTVLIFVSFSKLRVPQLTGNPTRAGALFISKLHVWVKSDFLAAPLRPIERPSRTLGLGEYHQGCVYSVIE